jgi:hypothetical protein
MGIGRGSGEIILVWACLAAAAVGLAVGLRFRLTMLLATSALLSLATIAVAISAGWSFGHTIAMLLLLLGILQVSYLIGLFATLRR